MSVPARKTGTPWLWAVILVIVGVVLLLDNFLLLGDFDASTLLPLLLVVAGAQILIRGDLLPSSEPQSFGITRGSVESGTLEISSGEIDIDVRALHREGRLIAGQFAGSARPQLDVQDTYAHIRLDRSDTGWLSFNDWRVGLAADLPWQVLVSTSLGQVNADLSDLIVHDGYIATGIGDIRLAAPREALGPLYVRSTLGNIHINTPLGCNVRIVINGGWMFRVKHNIYRYENPETDVYVSVDPAVGSPLVEIHISGTFGDAYLG